MLGWRQGVGLVGGLFGAFSLVVACGESEPRSPAGGAGGPDTQFEGGAAGTSGAGGAGGRTHTAGAGGDTGGDAPVLSGGGAGSDGGGAPAGGGGTVAGGGGAGADAGGEGGSGHPLGGSGNEAGAPSEPQPLIDDFEDHDNSLEALEGRQGYWFTSVDKFGSTIVPSPDVSGAAPLLPGSTNCHAGSLRCLIVSGTTVAADDSNLIYPFAATGFIFTKQAKVHAYDASAYDGIKLWLRGDAVVRVSIKTAATASSAEGGTCTANCGNTHGLSVILTNTWQQVSLPFATIQQEAWSTPVAFEPSQLLGVTVMFPPGNAFNAALDDVTFY